MRRLQFGVLAPEEIEQAFALVQAVTPQVSVEAWKCCAQWFLCPGQMPKGILSVKNEQGYLTGLCCYRQIDVVAQGRTAVADRVIALDLIDPSPIADGLIDALEHRAEELGCETVQVVLFHSTAGREPPWLTAVLRGRGYQPAAKTMVKFLRDQRVEMVAWA